MYEYSICIYNFMPEEDIGSHYRWLSVTMWLLKIELRTSGRASASALNHLVIPVANSL